jgi:3-hydroxyacyl-CoA dehydrogenase
VVTTAFELAKKMKKVPVRAGVCDGFIGNRILAVYKQAADYLMEDGASPTRSTRPCAASALPWALPGHRPGRRRHRLGHAQAPRRHARPQARYVEIADRICERGWFGQKTGAASTSIPQGARMAARPRSAGHRGCRARQEGVTPRSFSGEEIMRRYMAAMVNEGAKVVGEGIALRPLDVDVTFLSATAFRATAAAP